MANRQIRVYKRRAQRVAAQFVPPGTRTGVRECRRCLRPDQSMPVDLLLISGYATRDWSSDQAQQSIRHLGHIGEAMAEAETSNGGELGEAYVKTFRESLGAVLWVIEQAKATNNLEIILTAAKVGAEIGEMQAKIADAIPLKGRGRPTKEQIAEGTKPDVRDEDFDAAIADFRATKG